MNTPLQLPRRTQLKDYILPALVALAGAGAAYAGADTTFDPAFVDLVHRIRGQIAEARGGKATASTRGAG